MDAIQDRTQIYDLWMRSRIALRFTIYGCDPGSHYTSKNSLAVFTSIVNFDSNLTDREIMNFEKKGESKYAANNSRKTKSE